MFVVALGDVQLFHLQFYEIPYREYDRLHRGLIIVSFQRGKRLFDPYVEGDDREYILGYSWILDGTVLLKGISLLLEGLRRRYGEILLSEGPGIFASPNVRTIPRSLYEFSGW